MEVMCILQVCDRAISVNDDPELITTLRTAYAILDRAHDVIDNATLEVRAP
jgi:hypothetical protein